MSVSLLKLQRTIHAKLVLDRKGKREAIAREYWTWQRLLQGLGGQRLYSATRQKADRFRRRMCKQNRHGIEQREYAMILRRDCWMGERLVDVEEDVLDMSGAECPAYMLW
jgi:hypothetical protein